MPRLIATIISGASRPHFPLIVLESSLVQSSLPVLRALVSSEGATTHVLLFSLLYPPSTWVGVPPREGLCIVDRTAEVPGYSETYTDLAEFILNRVKQGTSYGSHYIPRAVVYYPYFDSAGWVVDGRHRLGRRPVCRPRVAIQIIHPHRRPPFQCVISSQ
jgi:hypothetical protein